MNKFNCVKELELLLDGVRDQGGTVSRSHQDHAIRLLEEKIRADERMRTEVMPIKPGRLPCGCETRLCSVHLAQHQERCHGDVER